MPKSDDVAIAKERWLELFRKAAPGSTMAGFTREHPEFGSYSKVQGWTRDLKFKARVAAIRDSHLRYHKVVRKRPKPEARAEAAPQADPAFVAPPRVTAPLRSTQPLSELEQTFFAIYSLDRNYDTIKACDESGLEYPEFRRRLEESESFRAEYARHEDIKLQMIEDQYFAQVKSGEDRKAVQDFLKARNSQYSRVASGSDGGGMNILTAGLQDAEAKWGRFFEAGVVRERLQGEAS